MAERKKRVAKKASPKKKVAKTVKKTTKKRRRTTKRTRKTKASKKVRVTRAKPAKKKNVLVELTDQIPKDKYSEVLLQQEELQQKKAKARPITPSVKEKKKATKAHLWLLVMGSFLIIFVAWIFTFQYNLRLKGSDVNADSTLSSFSEDFKKSLDSIRSDVFKLESMANQNTNNNQNINVIIKNPNNLREEDIEAMEEKVFPKLKQ